MTSPLDVGIIGCGLISTAHLRAWSQATGFRIAGVFDLNKDMADKRASEFSVEVFDSVEALTGRCDVVDVCTPPQTHAKLASQALTDGCHVVMEKPVVTDIDDWNRLSEQLASSDSKLAVIHNLKFLPSVRQAKEWVEEGRIGRILRIQREFMTSPATDRMLVGEGHWSHSLPGGRWFETLPHELYLTHYFAGPMDVDNVSANCTAAAPFGAPADEVLISLSDGAAFASIHFSANCEQNRRFFSIQGSEGNIAVDLLSDFASLNTIPDGKWKRALGGSVLDAGKTLVHSLTDRPRYAYQHLKRETPHSRIISDFARHLQGEGPHPTPLAEVDYVVKNCDRIGREIDRQRTSKQASE